MFRVKKSVRIAKYILLSVLTLSIGCLSRVHFGDNQKEVASHFPSRRLLDTRDDRIRIKNSFYENNGEKLLVIVVIFCIFVIFFVLYGILIICRCFIRCFCPDCLQGTLLGTILHIQLGTVGTVVPQTSNYASCSRLSSPELGRPSSGPSLAPPRTNATVILPIEGEDFPLHLYGIENPLYLSTDVNSEQYSNVVPIPEPTRQNTTALCEILDLPPSYTTFVKENHKYAKTSGNS